MAKNKSRIIVLGGGSGGLELAAELSDRGDCHVTLVDRVSTHLWKPRLHEFAAGTVNSMLTEISFYMLAQMRGFSFEQGVVERIDRDRKTIRLGEILAPGGRLMAAARELSYDLCVVALGGVTPDFGTTGVAEHAVRLDRKRDADAFRNRFVARMIDARENASHANVVIVDSGATGTELAAHLRLAEKAFFDGRQAEEGRRLFNISLLEAAPEIMPGADDDLRAKVLRRLDALDVDVHVSAKIEEVTETEVRAADGQHWPSDITVWAAGLVGNPCLEDLCDFETDKKGRIVVDDRLRSSVDGSIYVLGDAASLTPAGADAPLPPTAQCASQQARYLSDALPRQLHGGSPKAFAYSDKGRLISLAQAGSVGRVGFGRSDDFLVRGHFAAAAYRGLQRQHQWTVLGRLRGSVAIVADMMSPTKGPALKLHG